MSIRELRQRIRARLAEQRLLAQSLLRLREQMRGSLFVRYGVCGKAACACRLGRKHGPYYVLSQGSGGRGTFAYLKKSEAAVVKELLDRSKSFYRDLRRLRKVNTELLALLRRYQEAAARVGARRLGIAYGK